jgi:hypothetical protein
MTCRSGRCGSGWPGRHGYLLFEQPENGDARSRQELVDGPTLARVLVETAARLKESPTFVKLEKQEQVADHPLREVLPPPPPRSWAASACGWRTAAPTSTRPWRSPTSPSSACSPRSGRSRSPSVPCSASSPFRWLVPSPTGTAACGFYRIGAIVQLVLACAAWPLLSLGRAALTVVVIALSYRIGVNITPVTTFVTPDTRARDLTLLGDPVDDDTREIAARPTPLAASYRNTEQAPPVAV